MKHKGVVFSSLFAIPTRNGVYKGTNAHGEGCKIVNMGELFAYDVIVNQDMKRITMSEDELLKDGLCKNDLLFARRSLVEEGAGKVSIIGDITEPMTFESSIIRVRLDDSKCIPLFYYYWLKSPIGRGAISALVTGTNVKGIRASALKDIIVDYPPIIVQQQTAKVLKEYDDLIENNRKQIKLLEEAAQRLYKEWFVDLRFPGHEDMQIVDGVPKGWRKVTLSEISDVIMGQSPKSEFYNKDKEGLPFHQGVGSYGNRFVKDDTYSTSYTRIAEAGSILFSVRAPVGRLNITKNKIVIGRGLSAINHKEHLQSFLFYLLKERFFKEDMVGNGSIFASISKNELLGQEFIVPSSSLQRKFDSIASSIDRQIDNLDTKISLLTEARDRLLPKLMSGEIEL